MGRIPHQEVSFSSPGRPNCHKIYRSRKQAILKMLHRMNDVSHSQYAILIVDQKGRATIETSEAFREYQDAWFPEQLINQATDLTVAVVHELKARRRSEADQGKPENKATEGEGSGDDVDEFEDDADHDEEDGLKPNISSKQILDFPGLPGLPVPAYFAAFNPRDRKRSLQTNKCHNYQKKPRRSSAAKPPAIQRSDSNSGESHAVASHGGIAYKPLLISDHDAVTTFFETRFRQMQQLTCKVVAKAWIKVIEPKKQSNFPYNRGEESKPSWWPPGARHKEPDHLMKPERLLLLMTMLRCRRVPISKLESATSEVSGHIEECRIGLLEEIYRVAKMEERYVAGTLPHDACCYVAASADKIASSQKPHSPKPVQTLESPEAPTSANAGPIGQAIMGTQAGPEPGRANAPEMQTRQTPRPSPTDTRPQPNQFPVPRPQPNLQPLHTPLNFPATFMPTTQPPGDEYLDNVQSTVGNYYFPRGPLTYGQPTPAQRPLRRANSVAPQPFSGWPMQVASGMFSQYNTASQGPQSQHNHPQHGPPPLGSSNPPTPVSNNFQPMQLLPPPLPSIHHNSLGNTHPQDVAVSVPEERPNHYDSSRIPPHMNHAGVTFSEFLESPITERVYELGTGVGDGNMVGMNGGRGPEGPGLPGAKDNSGT